MAKHEIMIHENTSATKESAPYLGSYISKETLKTDEFAAKIAEKCGLPAIQVQAIIAGAFDAIEELEKEELVRLHVDGLTVCGIITGSFPTADAKFDPERNALQLALRLDEGVRNALADVTPSIITDASLTRLRIDNLADLEVQRPQNLVHGQHVFRVAGFCMVLSDEGAEAYFENAMGTRFELVIDEVISKQLFKAHTAALLAGGDYKLVIKSRAGDAAGPLQTATKRVKYLRVVDPPTVDSIATEGKDGIVKGEAFAATGSHLGWKDGDKVTVKWTEDGEEKSLEVTPKATTSTKMDFDAVEDFDDIPDDTELTFEFELSGESVEGETRLLAAVPTIKKLTRTDGDPAVNVIEHDGSLCRMFVDSMPDLTDEATTFSVTWTKADGSTVVKTKNQCDFIGIAEGYVMPQIPDDLAAGDTLRVKATYNGTDTNEVTVAVV